MLFMTDILFAVQHDQNPFIRKFPLQEGVITYATRGNHHGGQILYFSDYGRKQLLVEKMPNSILHKANGKERLTLILPDAKYIIDPKSGHALKSPRLEKTLYTLFQKLTKKEQQKILDNLQKTAPRSWENISGSCVKAVKKIAGYRCNEERIGGVRTCTIARGALPLEKRIELLGYTIDTFATKVTAQSIDPDYFKLPKDLTIVEGKERTDQKAERIIQNLLNDPKGCQKKISGSRSGEDLHLMLYEEIQNLSKNF